MYQPPGYAMDESPTEGQVSLIDRQIILRGYLPAPSSPVFLPKLGVADGWLINRCHGFGGW